METTIKMNCKCRIDRWLLNRMKSSINQAVPRFSIRHIRQTKPGDLILYIGILKADYRSKILTIYKDKIADMVYGILVWEQYDVKQ